MIDGEDAPFRNDDENKADEIATGDNGCANRDDGEQ